MKSISLTNGLSERDARVDKDCVLNILSNSTAADLLSIFKKIKIEFPKEMMVSKEEAYKDLRNTICELYTFVFDMCRYIKSIYNNPSKPPIQCFLCIPVNTIHESSGISYNVFERTLSRLHIIIYDWVMKKKINDVVAVDICILDGLSLIRFDVRACTQAASSNTNDWFKVP